MNIINNKSPKWKSMLAKHKSYIIEGPTEQKSNLTNDSFSESDVFGSNSAAQLESIFMLCDQVTTASDDES